MNKIINKALIAAATLAVSSSWAASPLVDSGWLVNKISDPQVVVIDLRKEEDYAAGHIPGALRATYGEFGWRETVDGVVGMLPPVAKINSLIGNLGITPDKQVIIVPYGNTSSDVGAGTRIYWTFKVLGHEQVSLLDGGHRGWTSQDVYTLERLENNPVAAASYPGSVDQQLLIDTAELLEQVESGDVQPIDARTDEQWVGDAKHPKARIPGAIPTAKRLPQENLVDPETGKFVSSTKVLEIAMANDWEVDGSKPLISYCNTGHWASTAWFALSEVAQVQGVRLYDGSMVAWTQNESNPTINTPSRFQQVIKSITGN